jgi:hypothetical protein
LVAYRPEFNEQGISKMKMIPDSLPGVLSWVLKGHLT